jgi:anaerobic sulfite reductase subunit A
MGTNETADYSVAVKPTEDGMLFEVKDEDLSAYFADAAAAEFAPEFVQENELTAVMPEIPDKEVLNALKKHDVWKEFNGRCISCGACTIACSTCTCFTTRDIIYGDNPEVGERRRVASSCQIDDYAKVAGGGDYRTTAGDRMRYKMLHKFHDYNKRFGEGHMCVGCGRCTSRCPEFISITTTLKKMNDAVEEIKKELGK